jgi:mannose-6-phosphate isomerase
VALLLNLVRLQPGEAIWMPAGNLHAYLFGAGVEIMAASDNVLRGGLTPKRVDVDELLRVLRFEVLDDPVVRPRPVAAGVVTWSTPVREFALYRVTLDAGATAAGVTLDAGATDAGVNRVTLAAGGPRVVLCRTGSVAVDDGAATVRLPAGQAAFAAAAGGPLVLSGSGEAYVATVGAGLATNREVSVLA